MTSEILKYAGEWSACPVDDGGATDFLLILLPSGGGAIAEFNWYLVYLEDIIWSIADDVLTVKTTGEDSIIINGIVTFEENAELDDITGKKYNFDCIWVGNNDKFYREPNITHSVTDEDLEDTLKARIAYLRNKLEVTPCVCQERNMSAEKLPYTRKGILKSKAAPMFQARTNPNCFS